MIKVSIIIPVYNDEEYLKECLNSVCAQTLKEKEIVCINDGSTDGSLSILENYAESYDNIVVISQANLGVGSARNVGINAARGDFIAFMDADDYYPSEDVLECLYRNAIAKGVLICGGSYTQDRGGDIISANP